MKSWKVPFHCLILCAAVAVQSTTSQAAKIFRAGSLPEVIQKAVGIRGYTAENQITSDLTGASLGSVTVKIELETRNQFVLYAEKTHFELEDSYLREWKIENVKNPPSMSFLDPISKKFKQGYTGQNVFELTLSLKNKIPKPLPVDYTFLVHTNFQACNKEVCLLPATVEVPIPLRMSTLAEPEDQQGVSVLDTLSNNLKQALGTGALGLGIFQILFLAGLLTAFTPCVYPLYPITIGIFVNWSRLGIRTWKLGLAYCAGSVFSYSLLGLVAVASGRVFGSLTQTPLFQLSIGAILIVSAIFYAGFFEFPIPESVRAFFSKSGPENSHPGRKIFEAFAMGFGLGIVASPCVGPVLVALLAWLSGYISQGPFAWIEGLGLFAIFGMGLMTPFLILSILVGRGFKTPRLGAWAQRAKFAGSFLMLLGSLYFIIPGIKGLTSHPRSKKFAFTAFTPENMPSNGKFSILDFRADWCVACLELEGETFQDSAVTAEINADWNFVKVDLTKPGSSNQKTAETYSVLGLPTLIFLGPGGKACHEQTLTGFENSKKFLQRLKRIKASCH